MSNAVFPYPGGKSRYADWIVEHFSNHSCFVEAFGGGAGVMLNKPTSHSEVYNDINDDLVQFFRVLRNRPNELVSFLEKLPYSRSEHERISTRWYDNDRRPDDDVKRAAWFYYLQQTSFSGKLEKSGFSISCRTDDNRARSYSNSIDRLDAFGERFSNVTIENLDWRVLFEKYDKPHTLFYLDPPYLKVGDDYYGHEKDFDHESFVEALHGLEGDWILSYGELPDGLDEYHTVTRETRYSMTCENQQYKTERLVMNYDITHTDSFSAGNLTLGAYQ